VDNARRVKTGVGCAPNNAEPVCAAAAAPAPRGRFGGGGALDSDRTGLADPPED